VYQRILFGLLGFAAAAGGALLILRTNSPELGGTALIIVAALFLSLMVIGRLPKLLEIAGVPLEFAQDEMAEFLRTLRAAADADTVLVLEDKLKRMSGDKKAFKDAQKRVDQEPEASAPVIATPSRDTEASRKEPHWFTELKRRAIDATVEKDARVLGGPGSGRGQPPRVHHLIRYGVQPVLVVENMTAWNDSTLEVLGRRLNRVMGNHPTVEKLVVILPDAGLADAERWREDLWGNEQNRKVEILVEGSDEATAVQSWVASLPLWKVTDSA
jgi:hypothetical protein